MRIEIDTTQKKLKVQENIKLGDLFAELKKMFPNNDWKDWTIEPTTVWQYYPYTPIYNTPYVYPYEITCSDHSGTITTPNYNNNTVTHGRPQDFSTQTFTVHTN